MFEAMYKMEVKNQHGVAKTCDVAVMSLSLQGANYQKCGVVSFKFLQSSVLSWASTGISSSSVCLASDSSFDLGCFDILKSLVFMQHIIHSEKEPQSCVYLKI